MCIQGTPSKTHDLSPRKAIVAWREFDISGDGTMLTPAASGVRELHPGIWQHRLAKSARPTGKRLRACLDAPSFLGGQKVEGVVVKNYTRFEPHTKHVLMAKFVSEAFKEVHAAEWKKDNPSPGDIIDNLIAQYRNPTRWAKAVQHLREAGQLEDAPKDIGLLFTEVPADVQRECEAEIKDALFALAWPKIRRGITAGLAEWYKERLLEQQFDGLDADVHLIGPEAR